MSQQNPPPQTLTLTQFLIGAALFEGGLLLVAFILGALVGLNPTAELQWIGKDFGLGFVATHVAATGCVLAVPGAGPTADSGIPPRDSGADAERMSIDRHLFPGSTRWSLRRSPFSRVGVPVHSQLEPNVGRDRDQCSVWTCSFNHATLRVAGRLHRPLSNGIDVRRCNTKPARPHHGAHSI